MKGNNKRDVHAGDVIGVGEHHGEVPNIAAAVGRRHGAGVVNSRDGNFGPRPPKPIRSTVGFG